MSLGKKGRTRVLHVRQVGRHTIGLGGITIEAPVGAPLRPPVERGAVITWGHAMNDCLHRPESPDTAINNDTRQWVAAQPIVSPDQSRSLSGAATQCVHRIEFRAPACRPLCAIRSCFSQVYNRHRGMGETAELWCRPRSGHGGASGGRYSGPKISAAFCSFGRTRGRCRFERGDM